MQVFFERPTGRLISSHSIHRRRPGAIAMRTKSVSGFTPHAKMSTRISLVEEKQVEELFLDQFGAQKRCVSLETTFLFARWFKFNACQQDFK